MIHFPFLCDSEEFQENLSYTKKDKQYDFFFTVVGQNIIEI